MSTPWTIRPDQAEAWPRGSEPPKFHIALRCDAPQASLCLLLGTEQVAISGGFGGWEVTGRPQQVGMTSWTGVEPFQMTIPVMLEGYSFTPQRSVEELLRRLMKVARGDAETAPGIIDLDGLPMPVDPSMQWVIEGIDFGDAILRASDGHRIRQALTLTVREYVPAKFIRVKKGALKGSSGQTKIVKAKDKDRVIDVARRFYCKWTDLRALNTGTAKGTVTITKASQKLKKNTPVRVPIKPKPTARRHPPRNSGNRR